jgi:dihydroorotase
MKRILLAGGQVVTGGTVRDADILINDEHIEAVDTSLPVSTLDADIIDINGLTVFPGLVDVHVHLREPGGEHKEDFYSGTCAALAGGITSVLAMPNTSPPIINSSAFHNALQRASKKAVCDYGLYVGGTLENSLEAAELHEAAALKLYIGSSTGSLLVDQLPAQLAHFEHYPRQKILAVHAEDEAAVQYYAKLGVRRPPICAALATSHVIALAEHLKRRIHICHVSTGYELEIIKAAKQRGLDITCEVAPHHLFLSTEDEFHLRALGQVNPPLRSPEDVSSLWAQLDHVDLIATDHAPHTLEEKASESPPSGMTGLETSLALMLTAASQGRISLPRISELMAQYPSEIFGFRSKGRIEQGYDADLALVDLNETWLVRNEDLHSRCGWTPFAGHTLHGRVKQTYLRGRRVFADGMIEADLGYGRMLAQS